MGYSKKMKDFHDAHGLPIALGVFPHPERCGIAEIDQEGTETSFIEKPDNPSSNLASAGIYIPDTKIFDVFPEESGKAGSVLDLKFNISPKMAGRIKCFEIDELIDIGTSQAYQTANRWRQNKER